MVRKIDAQKTTANIAESLNKKKVFFVGRNELIDVFFERYDAFKNEIVNAAYDPSATMFYGMPGIGKTSLIRELSSELQKRFDSSSLFVELDLKKDSFDMYTFLIRLYGQLSEKYKFQFPLFELGRYALDVKQGKSADKPEERSSIPWLKEGSALNEFFEIGEDLPVVGMVGHLLKLADKGISFAKKILDKNRFDLQMIEQANVNKLKEILHLLLKKDLEMEMQKMQNPLVVFIDGFEKIHMKKDAWIRGGLDEEKDWDENFEALIYLPKTMFVFAGRDPLDWPQKDEGWKDLLTQKEMNPLTSCDMETWLDEVNVEEPDLREKLMKFTEGVPLYLNTCMAHYKKMKERGFQPVIENFAGDKKEAVFCNLEEGERKTLFTLACLNTWTKPLLDYVGRKLGNKYGFPLVVNFEEKFKNSSFVERQSQDVYQINKIIGNAIAESEELQYMKTSIKSAAEEFLALQK